MQGWGATQRHDPMQPAGASHVDERLDGQGMHRLFTDEKSRAEIVTCRKVDAELLVERWALTWAQVDRL